MQHHVDHWACPLGHQQGNTNLVCALSQTASECGGCGSDDALATMCVHIATNLQLIMSDRRLGTSPRRLRHPRPAPVCGSPKRKCTKPEHVSAVEPSSAQKNEISEKNPFFLHPSGDRDTESDCWIQGARGKSHLPNEPNFLVRRKRHEDTEQGPHGPKSTFTLK